MNPYCLCVASRNLGTRQKHTWSGTFCSSASFWLNRRAQLSGKWPKVLVHEVKKPPVRVNPFWAPLSSTLIRRTNWLHHGYLKECKRHSTVHITPSQVPGCFTHLVLSGPWTSSTAPLGSRDRVSGCLERTGDVFGPSGSLCLLLTCQPVAWPMTSDRGN